MSETTNATPSTAMKIFKLAGKVWLTITSALGTLIIIGLISIVSLASVLAGSVSNTTPIYPSQVKTSGGEDEIAVLTLSGVIMENDLAGDPFSSGIISAERVTPMLEHFMTEDSIKAVVIRISTPGGAVVASDELGQKVRQLATKKPVVVSFGDVSASGGYYFSAGATKIIANPSTITGSIGVIAQFPEYSGLFDKIGVSMRTFKSGEFKDIGSGDRPMTEAERNLIQGIIDENYDQFVKAVVEGRKMDELKVRQLADGRIYTGTQAKQLGLVDELGNLDTAIDQAKQLSKVEDPTIIEYTSKNFIEQILSSTANRILPTTQIPSSVTSQLQPGVYYLLSW